MAPLLRLPLQIVCEPAQLVRNVRCTQSEITQGLSRFVEKRSQIFFAWSRSNTGRRNLVSF